MSEKNRIVVFTEGGCIQWILAERDDVIILHIDSDVQDLPDRDNSVMEMLDVDANKFNAECSVYLHEVAPETVAQYFEQVEHQMLVKSGLRSGPYRRFVTIELVSAEEQEAVNDNVSDEK